MISALKKVKALGAAGNGTEHWWMQRVTAVAMIPLSIWFVLKLLCACHKDSNFFFGSAFSSLFFALFLITALYHASLGMKVIIEDYVSCKKAKFTALIVTNLFVALTGFMLFAAIINNIIKL